jgi:hypothetical protein
MVPPSTVRLPVTVAVPVNVGLARGALVLSCVCTFDVTPSTKLSSAAVAVTDVPAIIKEPRSRAPVMSTTAAPAPAPSA